MTDETFDMTDAEREIAEAIIDGGDPVANAVYTTVAIAYAGRDGAPIDRALLTARRCDRLRLCVKQVQDERAAEAGSVGVQFVDLD